MKKRYTEEQIITILREAESGAMPVKALCKRHNISEQTFFRWRTKFGGMDEIAAESARSSQRDYWKRIAQSQESTRASNAS